ncbi:MAG TPA: ATP-binding protein [Chloroflexota bacterium]|nr:ATP-binding protein [Chloroflexota bacterium]
MTATRGRLAFSWTWIRDWGVLLTGLNGVLVVLFLVGIAVNWGASGGNTLLPVYAYFPIQAIPILLVLRAAKSFSRSAPGRMAWIAIALAQLGVVVGNCFRIYDEGILHTSPFPSLADAGYLAFYPMMFLGLVYFARVFPRNRDRVKLWLDIGTVLVGGGVAVWFLILGPVARGDLTDLLALAVALAYPIGDLAVVLGVAVIATRQIDDRSRRALGILVLSQLAFVSSDLIYGSQSLQGAYQAGSLTDVGWMLAALLMCVSGLVQSRASVSLNAVKEQDSRSGAPVLNPLPYLAVGLGYALFLFATLDQWRDPRYVIYVGVVVLTVLVLVRQVIVIKDNTALYGRLEAAFNDVLSNHSALVEANALLDALRRRHELILQSAAEGIFGIDHQEQFTFVNAAAARMFGYAPGDLLGENIHRILHFGHSPDAPDRSVTGQIRATLQDGSTNHVPDEIFWRGNHTSFPIDYLSTPIWEEGAITGAVITFKDMTEDKRAEVELRQAQKLESVGLLASGIAHEINTPIQFIGDNCRFLRQSLNELLEAVHRLRTPELLPVGLAPTPATTDSADTGSDARLAYLEREMPRAIDQTLDGIERVATIVGALKEFAHPDSREQEPADLNEALLSTLIVARNVLKDVAEVKTDLGELPLVNCYVGELNQVFLNLMVNAAHAIGELPGEGFGEITIRTRRQLDQVRVTIADTGCGIPQGIRERIFDPFFTTKGIGRGTGQGLALARSLIVDKHQGTISFESEEGKGTTFTISLPIAGAPPTSTGRRQDESYAGVERIAS